VGLKPTRGGRSASRASRLNRTSVGLKPVHHHHYHHLLQPGLNRTSVGLKHSQPLEGRQRAISPQSNQRGIETSGRKNPKCHCNTPQSNQRGIETG